MKNPVAAISCTLLAVAAALPAAQATEVFQNTSATFGYTTQAKADPVMGTGTSDTPR